MRKRSNIGSAYDIAHEPDLPTKLHYNYVIDRTDKHFLFHEIEISNIDNYLFVIDIVPLPQGMRGEQLDVAPVMVLVCACVRACVRACMRVWLGTKKLSSDTYVIG